HRRVVVVHDLVEREAVLETGAAAALHEYAKLECGIAFLIDQLLDLHGRSFGKLQWTGNFYRGCRGVHRFAPGNTTRMQLSPISGRRSERGFPTSYKVNPSTLVHPTLRATDTLAFSLAIQRGPYSSIAVSEKLHQLPGPRLSSSQVTIDGHAGNDAQKQDDARARTRATQRGRCRLLRPTRLIRFKET